MKRLAVEQIVVAVAIGLALVASLGGNWWLYNERVKLTDQVGELAKSLQVATSTLANLQNVNLNLASTLDTEQKKNTEFASQIGNIASTVGVLDKLRKTDKELLVKYSKIFFLNENYVPASLALIDTQYLSDQKKPLQFQNQVHPFLVDLMTAAGKAGLDLKILSAYRSFGVQANLKSSYQVTYGSGANKFSADQGYSEHQLGTTIDFTTSKINSALTGFSKTPEYEWLQKYAYRFGFTLSYPENNTYYEFEPWHWRFVGVELATYLHNEGKHFYDLDQREIDTYLVKIFD
ncbi:MAG: M15 family metallopeptidase [bacterium]|nr:M15 family metallopeptidase [bacterium]